MTFSVEFYVAPHKVWTFFGKCYGTNGSDIDKTIEENLLHHINNKIEVIQTDPTESSLIKINSDVFCFLLSSTYRICKFVYIKDVRMNLNKKKSHEHFLGVKNHSGNKSNSCETSKNLRFSS